MATKDNFYIFNKTTKVRSLLGEIQSDFNMSFTIDGTKDSCSVQVWSLDDYEIEPYTICYHEKTNTYWVVSHDKIDRFKNESGYLYIHNLDLLGAIELLNARDLTDCGFNANRYTIRQFIDRLFSLSNFEFNGDSDRTYTTDLDLTKKVEFIKAFENYTLLSALREFLDGYNCAIKMSFTTTTANNSTTLSLANFNIILKTGNASLTSHDIEYFNNVRETKTLAKESFGTCVVSNAENVTSSVAKTFPRTGAAKLSGTEYKIAYDNAVLRLPSKVYKPNWIKILYDMSVKITVTGGSSSRVTYFYYYPSLDKSYENLKQAIDDFIVNMPEPWEYDWNSVKSAFDNDFILNKATYKPIFDKLSSLTVYSGNKLVPYFGSNNDQNGTIIIEKGDNVPYLVKLSKNTVTHKDIIFVSKEDKELLVDKDQGIAYERGSNIISGFTFLNEYKEVLRTQYTDFQEILTDNVIYELVGSNYGVKIEFTASSLNVKNTHYIVNYYPMSDVKIKVDNQRDKKDIQLYNQTGRLTDSVALSKLINSYSKEISSDNIVKYMQFTNYNSIPSVGSFVSKNNNLYVINNISMTFTQNENNTSSGFGYFIDCEFNMSKAISTKSMLTNPDTDIRDYGIPQNYNVKRKQLYRDYYEISYVTNNDNDRNYYLEPIKIFGFGHYHNRELDLSGVIKLNYTSSLEGSYNWYYQLETTNYYLDKMIYAVLDFNDNNIIGYGSQNVFSGFLISRILSGLTDLLNTPISYVDNNGEFAGVSICLCSNDQINSIYQEYEEDNGIGLDIDLSLYNYSCFIPVEIYSAALNNCNIFISEPYYNKDALEVPVFEYVCQIEDSDDILIGDRILSQPNENIVYFYSFVKGDNLTPNNATTSETIDEIYPNTFELNNVVNFSYTWQPSYLAGLLNVSLYSRCVYDSNFDTWNNYTQLDFEIGKDYAIFRHSLNLETKEETIELMFIAKKVPSQNIFNQTLALFTNHYKLN